MIFVLNIWEVCQAENFLIVLVREQDVENILQKEFIPVKWDQKQDKYSYSMHSNLYLITGLKNLKTEWWGHWLPNVIAPDDTNLYVNMFPWYRRNVTWTNVDLRAKTLGRHIEKYTKMCNVEVHKNVQWNFKKIL